MAVRRFILTMCTFAAASAVAAEVPLATPAPGADLLGNVNFAVDRDGVHVSEVRLGGVHACGAYLDALGYGARPTDDDGVAASRGGAAPSISRSRDTAASAIRAETGFLEVAGRTRLVGNATWRAEPVAQTTLALVAAGDLVAAQPAIDRGIAYGFVGGSATRPIAERITASGVAGYQTFTDGNERLDMRARLTWQAVPQLGLDAQLRWRQFESRDDLGDPTYFNPDRYAQWTGVIDVHRQVRGWTIAGMVGAGVETIDGTERHSVRTAELRATGAIVENVHVTVYARYNRSADDADVPETSFVQAGVTLRHPF